MILYDYKCAAGHRFEAGVASMTSPNPDCPACGAATSRALTSVQVGGTASAGPSREQMPRSWKSIGGGHPDAVRHWRSAIEKREKLEDRYPELGGDRRPVLAHEGIFRDRPLRAGDDIGASVKDALNSSAAAGGRAGREPATTAAEAPRTSDASNTSQQRTTSTKGRTT
ncbi:hypothetical protein GCM10022261_02240 [Brevibacterium daeguense]|uniref:Putative regulatory protein FmdB zinc ribbon domain-containing protein n=1 Tax=Brevibacterium daeguense TaxID=909936 RepID=A0ABP8EFE2_9MICO|nr:zinc ribbon domain-containing protein [Brevibacterium daeguense]